MPRIVIRRNFLIIKIQEYWNDEFKIDNLHIIKILTNLCINNLQNIENALNNFFLKNRIQIIYMIYYAGIF